MLYYDKITEKSNDHQFKVTDEACAELKDVIQRLLTDHPADLHVMVICTDCEDEVQNEKIFQDRSDEQESSAGLRQSDNEQRIDCTLLGSFKSLGDALKQTIEYVRGKVDDAYINKDAESAVSIYCQYEGFSDKADASDEWREDIANRASHVLRTSQMERALGHVPNICASFMLPESFFNTFLRPDCYFPSFIKYVIRAVDGAQALKALQAQVQERNQIIAKQRQFIDKVKNELVDFQSELGENATDQAAPPAEAPSEVNAQEKDQAAEPAQETQNLAMDMTGISEPEHHESEVLG